MRRGYDTIATLYFELDYTLQSIKTFRDKSVCVCVCVRIDYNKDNNNKYFY